MSCPVLPVFAGGVPPNDASQEGQSHGLALIQTDALHLGQLKQFHVTNVIHECRVHEFQRISKALSVCVECLHFAQVWVLAPL